MHKKLFKSIDVGGKCTENTTYCKNRAVSTIWYLSEWLKSNQALDEEKRNRR